MVWKADRYGAGYKNVKRHVWVRIPFGILDQLYSDRFIPICGAAQALRGGMVYRSNLIKSELLHCKKCLRITEEAVISYSES